MERSTFYDKKKEAVLVFGLSLWGNSIPKLRGFLRTADEEETEGYIYGSTVKTGPTKVRPFPDKNPMEVR